MKTYVEKRVSVGGCGIRKITNSLQKEKTVIFFHLHSDNSLSRFSSNVLLDFLKQNIVPIA